MSDLSPEEKATADKLVADVIDLMRTTYAEQGLAYSLIRGGNETRDPIAKPMEEAQ